MITQDNTNTVMDIPEVDRKNAVAITLTFHKLGDQREGNIDEMQTSADKGMMKAVKKLFGGEKEGDSNCSEFDAIKSFDGKMYRWLCDQSVPLLGRRNVRLISSDAIATIEAKLVQAQKERSLLVNAFLKVYPIVIEAAKTKLNGQYNASDYPSVEAVGRKFSVDWNYLALGVPDNLPDEVKKEAAAKVENMWREAGEQIRDGLRIGFVKLVEHLLEKLTPAPDGKAKRFYDTNVTNIISFIDTLAQRNLTNDKALVEVANKAKALLVEYSQDCDKIKSDVKVRNSITASMSEIKAACDAMIGTEKRRKFQLDG